MDLQNTWDDNQPWDDVEWPDDNQTSELCLDNCSPTELQADILDIFKYDIGYDHSMIKGSSVSEAYAEQNGLHHPGARDIDVVIDVRTLFGEEVEDGHDDDALLQAAKNAITMSGHFEISGEAARFTSQEEDFSTLNLTMKYQDPKTGKVHDVDVSLVTHDVTPWSVMDVPVPVWSAMTDGEYVYAQPDFKEHYATGMFVPDPSSPHLDRIKQKFERSACKERNGWTFVDPGHKSGMPRP